MKRLVLLGLSAALLIGGVAESVKAQSLARYELNVVNNTSVDLKHVYVRDPDTGRNLGDKLVGKIVARTSAIIDLSNARDQCVFDLVAVFYDGDSVRENNINICRNDTWRLSDRRRRSPYDE